MELAQKLLANLFPSRCILCSRTVTVPSVNEHIELCADCYRSLPFNHRCCTRCALPLAEDIAAGTLCGRCITKLPEFDYARSLFSYQDGVIPLVQQLKFSEKITFARTIGELLLLNMQADARFSTESPTCLLPVPLHASRLRQRGYNQSIEISRVIAKKFGLPIEYEAITRERSTSAQTGLNARQRLQNIKGAFAVKRQINFKHVLIVDDVVTTGATVNELARLLKKNNVERVGVLSIARAPIKA